MSDVVSRVTHVAILVTAGAETRVVAAGGSVLAPHGTRHPYRNDGPAPARMAAVLTPAGIEGRVREACTPDVDPAAPPPVTGDLIRRMLEAGPRDDVGWTD